MRYATKQGLAGAVRNDAKFPLLKTLDDAMPFAVDELAQDNEANAIFTTIVFAVAFALAAFLLQ